MNMPDISLAPVTDADFEELALLRIEAMRESLEQVGRFDPDRARERLRRTFHSEDSRAIVVDGRRVGFFTFRPDEDGFHLDHINVHPAWQTRGIGSRDLRHLEAQADQAQKPMHLNALRGSDANRFYRRHGFTATREEEWDIRYIRAVCELQGFAAPSEIHARRVFLRPISEADLPSLLVINSDPEVVRHLGYAPWQTIADAEAWFARISKSLAAGSALEFVIVEKQGSECLGRCGLFDYDAIDSQASLGYTLGRPHWRQGYMREALTALIDGAFAGMGLRRLEAKVEAPNTPSSGLLRRLGFTQEGILRERWVGPDGTIDAAVFGLLRHEWLPFPQLRRRRSGAAPTDAGHEK